MNWHFNHNSTTFKFLQTTENGSIDYNATLAQLAKAGNARWTAAGAPPAVKSASLMAEIVAQCAPIIDGEETSLILSLSALL